VEDFGGAATWVDRIGLVPTASFTASKWAWLRRCEPAHAAATAAVRLPHDYLNERLTGAGVTDRGDASGTAWWSSETESYSTDVLGLRALELDPDKLPRVLRPTEPAGPTTRAAAAEAGLAAGALIGPGTGLHMATALALGLRPGVPVLDLGDHPAAYVVSDHRVVDPTGKVAGLADASGRFLAFAELTRAPMGERVMASQGPAVSGVAPRTTFDGSPGFARERVPRGAGAPSTFPRRERYRETQGIRMAAYEADVIGLLEALELVSKASSGVDPAEPFVLIGREAHVPAWQQLILRSSTRAIKVPAATDLAALGAAVQAAAVFGWESPQHVAERWGTAAGIVLEPAQLA
jgi:xylulokinase